MSRVGRERSGSTAQNQKAQLANAYNELGKELSSSKIRVVGNYTLGKVIGEGTYGKVRLGTHRLTSTRVAIKQIPKALSAALTREIHHHRQLHHPHVTQLYEVIATENSIWLVTELCSGGELFDYLTEKGRLSEDETRIIFGQLCLAVAYIHEKGIVHRDLKLENVLLDERCRVKLGDFGFTREFDRGAYLETFCGTTGYAAPEMLEGKKYLGPEVDVWSLGVILYVLLTGTLPFDDDDESIMRQKVISAEFEDPEWLSDEIRDLVKKILQKDPIKRISIQQILAHPWFSNARPSSSVPTQTALVSSPAQTAPQPYEASGSSVASDSTLYSEPDGSSTTTPDEDLLHELLPDAKVDEQLPQIHRNPSQITIKKAEIKINTEIKRLQPETVMEEEVLGTGPLNAGQEKSPMSAKEPPALPARTPVRTKRRSVSSTLSDPPSPTTERSVTPLPPQDFVSLLNKPAPIIFGTAFERELLNNLSALGFDTGQIVHSVLSNACDSASAVWWMLKRKAEKRALEEGGSKSVLAQIEEHEHGVSEMHESVERKGSKKKNAVEQETSQANHATLGSLASVQSAPELAFIPATPTVSTHQHPKTPPRARSPNRPFLSPSPSISDSTAKTHPSTPSSNKEKDGSKGRREGKARSGSVSIMQRATTALEAAGLVRKRSAEAVKEEKTKEREKDCEKRSSNADEPRSSHGSGSKLTKSPPLRAAKDPAPPSPPLNDHELVSATAIPASPWVVTGDVKTPSTSPVPTLANSPGDTLTSLPSIAENVVKSTGHGRNRASLLTAFRMWFNEERRGKRKSEATAYVGPPPAGRNTFKAKRRSSGNSGKGHRAKGHSISSHRSSSVNSRRSSTASMQMVVMDSPLEYSSRQRSDTSRRSFSSHTPNSERGEYISSRPSSVHSFNKQRHGKSPSASSAGSIARTASPYHRRGGSGSSTRVVRSPTHGNQVLRPPHMRSNSTTSSIHSLPSSRPGSFYEQSEGENQRTSSPYKQSSRRNTDGRGSSTFVAQKRQTPFMPPTSSSSSLSRSSWKKSWGLEPPGWQTRTTHLPIEVLSVSPAGEGSSTIRDVFSGRHSISLADDDDDWVDEDDDMPAFAGGLGQFSASVGVPVATGPEQMFGSYTPPSETLLPTPVLTTAPRSAAGRITGKRGNKGFVSVSRSKPGQSPVGRISPLPLDAAFEGPESRGATRRQLPNNRPGPAFRGHAIQEEDEGEEE